MAPFEEDTEVNGVGSYRYTMAHSVCSNASQAALASNTLLDAIHDADYICKTLHGTKADCFQDCLSLNISAHSTRPNRLELLWAFYLKQAI